jgi:hypothetical protein
MAKMNEMAVQTRAMNDLQKLGLPIKIRSNCRERFEKNIHELTSDYLTIISHLAPIRAQRREVKDILFDFAWQAMPFPFGM